jgi:uncharacterized glyoxalase superfamily protein PhnB
MAKPVATDFSEISMTAIDSPVPVLQVKDVERSIDWYASVFGFEADSFPDVPSFSFAILRRDRAEITLQCSGIAVGASRQNGWSVYLRMSGGQLLEFAEAVRRRTALAREPERTLYGEVEFEVVDPDGHVICVAEPRARDASVPTVREGQSAA